MASPNVPSSSSENPERAKPIKIKSVEAVKFYRGRVPWVKIGKCLYPDDLAEIARLEAMGAEEELMQLSVIQRALGDLLEKDPRETNIKSDDLDRQPLVHHAHALWANRQGGILTRVYQERFEPSTIVTRERLAEIGRMTIPTFDQVEQKVGGFIKADQEPHQRETARNKMDQVLVDLNIAASLYGIPRGFTAAVQLPNGGSIRSAQLEEIISREMAVTVPTGDRVRTAADGFVQDANKRAALDNVVNNLIAVANAHSVDSQELRARATAVLSTPRLEQQEPLGVTPVQIDEAVDVFLSGGSDVPFIRLIEQILLAARSNSVPNTRLDEEFQIDVDVFILGRYVGQRPQRLTFVDYVRQYSELLTVEIPKVADITAAAHAVNGKRGQVEKVKLLALLSNLEQAASGASRGAARSDVVPCDLSSIISQINQVQPINSAPASSRLFGPDGRPLPAPEPPPPVMLDVGAIGTYCDAVVRQIEAKKTAFSTNVHERANLAKAAIPKIDRKIKETNEASTRAFKTPVDRFLEEVDRVIKAINTERSVNTHALNEYLTVEAKRLCDGIARMKKLLDGSIATRPAGNAAVYLCLRQELEDAGVHEPADLKVHAAMHLATCVVDITSVNCTKRAQNSGLDPESPGLADRARSSLAEMLQNYGNFPMMKGLNVPFNPKAIMSRAEDILNHFEPVPMNVVAALIAWLRSLSAPVEFDTKTGEPIVKIEDGGTEVDSSTGRQTRIVSVSGAKIGMRIAELPALDAFLKVLEASLETKLSDAILRIESDDPKVLAVGADKIAREQVQRPMQLPPSPLPVPRIPGRDSRQTPEQRVSIFTTAAKRRDELLQAVKKYKPPEKEKGNPGVVDDLAKTYGKRALQVLIGAQVGEVASWVIHWLTGGGKKEEKK